jgi:anti-anti-sigma regulatory factor
MNQKFQAVVHHKDDMTYVKLSGVIDEDNELTTLADKIPGGTVVINLGEVDRINSCGVRDWVNWLGRIEKSSARPVLVECSPAIVAQINLVNNFTGTGVVKSFFAPYFCPNCDREKVLLVEAAELGSAPHKAPTCRCDECDGVMDFDDMEDSYFAFLATAKRLTEQAQVSKVLSEFAGAEKEKSKIRSRVGSTTSSSPSLPSVPSLPSISRSTPAPGSVPSASALKAPTMPGMNAGKSSMPSLSAMTPRPGSTSTPSLSAAASMPPKTNKMLYLLVVLILAAIGVLAVFLFSSGSKDKKTEAKPAVSTYVANR